jgi:hypothetical protein
MVTAIVTAQIYQNGVKSVLSTSDSFELCNLILGLDLQKIPAISMQPWLQPCDKARSHLKIQLLEIFVTSEKLCSLLDCSESLSLDYKIEC